MALSAQQTENNKPIITHIRIVKRVPAHEKALNQINVIKQQHVENQETQKVYYTQLTNTLREYIVSRFGFNAMEMTSMEIIERLREAGDQKMIDELKELFQTADLVKFAKYETLVNENDANLVNAINFIDQTKTDEKPTEEKVVPQLTNEEQKTQSQRRLIKSLPLDRSHRRSGSGGLHHLPVSHAADVKQGVLMKRFAGQSGLFRNSLPG